MNELEIRFLIDEVEGLRAENAKLTKICDSYATENQQFHDENEWLRAENDRLKSMFDYCKLENAVERLRTALEGLINDRTGYHTHSNAFNVARATLEETK